MSDTKTPETDWVIKNCNGWHHVPAEKARELEIERNALIDERDKLKADAAAMQEALEQYARPDFYLFLLSPMGQKNDPCSKAAAALSVNAGRELLGELKRLRTELAEMTTIAEKARTRELEQLDELSTLRTDLAKAHAQCAKLRSEVERAWREGFIDGDFGEASADDCWNQSRARKVATGELNK